MCAIEIAIGFAVQNESQELVVRSKLLVYSVHIVGGNVPSSVI